MGSEQSNNNHNTTSQKSQMSEAQVKRLLEDQRLKYEKKCQEMVAKAAAQETANTANPTLERDRAPYQYTKDDLQNQTRASNLPQPMYPNLNDAATCSSNVHSFNFQNNNACNQPRPQASNPFHQQGAPVNNAFHPGPQHNLLQQPGPHHNNPFNQPRPQDFVFVNNFGQAEASRMRPAPSAPSAPQVPAQRPRSVSRNRNSPRQRDVLDCVTCQSRFGLKIFQCNNGHSSCNDCKTRSRRCGVCGENLTNRRNYEMENHMSQVKVPCPNSSDGCKLFIKMGDMETHTKECPFKEQECPLASVFGNCQWRGKLNQMSCHFDNMHSSQRQTDVDTEMQLMNICNNSQQVHLVVLGVYNFLFHLKVSEADRNIYMTVQLIGTKMSAGKWLYEIHVYNKNEKHRKYMFTDNCKSSSVPVDNIIKEKDCAVLPVSYATTFVNNGAMTYKFFIKKTNDGKRDFGKYQRGREVSSDREENRGRSKSKDMSKHRSKTVRQWVNSNIK